MLKQNELISSFQSFTELIILKVLEAHRDTEKDVSLFYLIDQGWAKYALRAKSSPLRPFVWPAE